QGRSATLAVEQEDVVAGGGLGLAGAVVVERAHAGVGPHHVVGTHGPREAGAGGGAQVVDLLAGGVGRRGVAVIVAVGGADEGEVALVGNGEDDAAVRML